MNNIRIVGETPSTPAWRSACAPELAPLVPLLNRHGHHHQRREKQLILDAWGEPKVAEQIDYRRLLLTTLVAAGVYDAARGCSPDRRQTMRLKNSEEERYETAMRAVSETIWGGTSSRMTAISAVASSRLGYTPKTVPTSTHNGSRCSIQRIVSSSQTPSSSICNQRTMALRRSTAIPGAQQASDMYMSSHAGAPYSKMRRAGRPCGAAHCATSRNSINKGKR